MKASDILLDGFGESKNFNPKKSLKRYFKHKWFFIASVLITVSLAILYLIYSTPYYEISSKVVIRDREKGVDFSDNPLMKELDSYRSSKIIENEIEVFKSVQLMKSVVEDLDIVVGIFSKDALGRQVEYYKYSSPIQVDWQDREWKYKVEDDEYRIKILDKSTYELSFDGKIQKYKFGQLVSGHFGKFSINLSEWVDLKSLEQLEYSVYFYGSEGLARSLSKGLNVYQISKQSSVLQISRLDNIPERGVDIIDNLISKYNSETEEEKNYSASNATAFLSKELSTLAAEIDSIESRIERLKSQNRISDIDTEARLSLENANQNRNQIADVRTQIQVVESIQNLLRNSSNENTKSIPSSLNLNDPSLVAAIENYNGLVRDKERLLRDVQPSNPLVVSINDKIRNQKLSIEGNLVNLRSSLQISINNLESSSSRYEGRSSRIPQIERDLQEITRLRLTKLEQFQNLSKKYDEAQMSLSATSNSFLRIIDSAKASFGPVKPNKIVILAFAVIMGFGIPFVVIFIKNLFNDKVETKEEVENITQLPVIAEISENENEDVFSMGVKSPVAEQFRLLRSNLFSLNGGVNDGVILVTSTVSGEGKTFCSLNLATSLSLIGKRVIVLEFDLRKPTLIKKLKVQRNHEGIIEYLNGESSNLQSLIHHHPDRENLWYMEAGKLVSNPSELINSPKLDDLITLLKLDFDYVVIDSSPVGMVPDAFTLCKYADSTLYVVKSNYTTSEHLGFLSNFGVKEKLKNPTLILNGVNVVNGYGYGYDYEPSLT
ncbi:GumC family protein [Belliella kenyensis]|uniref:non-specific protein-tyrosine kinase n=1 Tax=Belliella kenyensis TaxID=1472724 RepID=A0ABV8EHG5_9BACT|nr:tyrosine-protein kinase family protein [Belliella kenyensis]MCH7402647.1 AAA family ATPase [Belliella kenyensis]MDN3603805.1 AAA family ATPase [Belliella kenyensis]